MPVVLEFTKHFYSGKWMIKIGFHIDGGMEKIVPPCSPLKIAIEAAQR